MRDLRPSELAAILTELGKQKEQETRAELADIAREQQNLAAMMAVIVNSAQGIAGMFSKRRPKTVKPEDFLSKDFKKLIGELFEAQDAKQTDWASCVEDAKDKGLKGPW